MLPGLLALTLTAVFAGAAVYVSFAEQPARLNLDDEALLAEWQPSYKRGTIMQASLAIVCCALGLWAWWQSGATLFLVGAVLIILAWPWTMLVMLPTNRELEKTAIAEAGPQTRDLIVKWGRMHLARLALGVAAALVYLLANMA